MKVTTCSLSQPIPRFWGSAIASYLAALELRPASTTAYYPQKRSLTHMPFLRAGERRVLTLRGLFQAGSIQPPVTLYLVGSSFSRSDLASASLWVIASNH